MKKIVPPDAVLIPKNARRVFEGQIFDVYQWPQQLFDGSTATFEMLKRPDTVEIIGIEQDKILIVHDDQPNVGIKMCLPGGRVDALEAVLQAGRRELLEETGYSFKNWRLINVWQPMTKMERFFYFFLAWDEVTISKTKFDAGERIKLEHLTLNQVKDAARRKIGYMDEVRDLLEPLNSIKELLGLPEYVGKEVDVN